MRYTPQRIAEGLVRRIGFLLSDKIYLKALYRAHMGYPLNLRNPQTFNEKLQWLKLYNRQPYYTQLVDKIEVKKWVADKIGAEHIIPTYEVWNSAEEINVDKLPKSFVLKCNHSGGNSGVFLVKDKEQFDLESAKKRLAKELKHSIYDNYREWPYKDVYRRVLAEQLLGVGIEDFKFFCYDGFVESVMVAYERNTGNTKFYFFDKDWNLKRYNIRGKEAPEGFSMPKPKNVDQMFAIASELSKGLPFVRVDLYNINGKIYFGEMTFFPDSGMDEKILPEVDKYFGSFLKLPQSTER